MNDATYLTVALDSGDRISVYRSGQAVYVPVQGTPTEIADVWIDDDDETFTRLRARSLRMWLRVRRRGVVSGILCGLPASGSASYQ